MKEKVMLQVFYRDFFIFKGEKRFKAEWMSAAMKSCCKLPL